MKLKVITLKFSDEQGSFDNAHLEECLQGKEVMGFREVYFERNGDSYWNVLVHYRENSKADERLAAEKKTYQEILEESDLPLFEILRNWRNGKSKQLGLAAYVVMSNMEIAHIAHRRPQTLPAFREIPGIGDKKTENYGQELLEVIRKFQTNDKKGTDAPRTS